MSAIYYDQDLKHKLEELEKQEQKKRKRQKRKEIMESLKHKEVVITTETEIQLETKIAEMRNIVEDLKTERDKTLEEIENLDMEIINKTEQLKNLKQELSMDRDFQLALAKIQKGIEKRKKSQQK
jgi:sensor domain CHASE-containing protein